MAIACVIPARLNSARFPRKLLAVSMGKTVLQRTFEQASQCSDLDALFVATDSDEIASHIHSLGGYVIWTSPSCRNGTERLGEALEKCEALQKASLIINLQGDHPCTKPETLSAIIRILKSDPKAVMSTAVSKIESREDFLSPHTVKCVFDSFFNALYFSRSPIPYIASGKPIEAYAHIGIYCYRTEFLKKVYRLGETPLQNIEDLEQLKVLETGQRIKVALVKETILGIDTPNDLARLGEFLCQSNISL